VPGEQLTPRSTRRFVLAGLGVAATLGFGQAAWAGGDDRAKVLLAPPPSIPGPKRTIAVGQIDVIGPYANASVTSVGGAIAGMLTTALEESDQFIVVERDALPALITEQTLAKAGVSTGSDAPQPGRVLPARYIIVGAVTDYTLPSTGSGGGFSIGGSTALTLGGSKGDVALDLRLVDTRTGAVIKAFKVKRKLTSLNLGLSSSYSGVPIATNKFFNSALGDATRRALNDAVQIIAATLAATPWQGQVVDTDGGLVYVNAGAEAGMAVGDRLAIQRVAKTFTDPATGAILSERMQDVGVVTITNVEPKMASGSYVGTEPPQRGDLLVQVR
jgi:curli biogenesis system outer membrane secretion channel CsgG